MFWQPVKGKVSAGSSEGGGGVWQWRGGARCCQNGGCTLCMVWCTARSPGAAHSLITQGPSMDPPWMRPPAQLTAEGYYTEGPPAKRQLRRSPEQEHSNARKLTHTLSNSTTLQRPWISSWAPSSPSLVRFLKIPTRGSDQSQCWL